MYAETGGILELLNGKTLLHNQGGLLCLYDSEGSLSDWVKYEPGMHVDEYFANGGWSLERLDPGRPCGGLENWSSSLDRKGGTPGRRNSLHANNPDRIHPQLTDIYIRDSISIILEFSEPMSLETINKPGNYFIRDGNIETVLVEVPVPMNREAHLTLSDALDHGKIYEIGLDRDLRDCAGLEILPGGSHRFALPLTPYHQCLLISEVLFDPLPGCPEFIEIYNHTDNTFDLIDVRMGIKKQGLGVITDVMAPVGHSTLVFPGDFLVLSREPGILPAYYTTGEDARYVEVPRLASNDDRSGTILILDKWLGVIDELKYDEKMHHPLLSNTTGISLERLSYDMPSWDLSNWHSASFMEGSATPGRKNSHQPGEVPAIQEVYVEPQVFSPDQDGIRDICHIHYQFDYPGKIINARIFDSKGRLISIIAENRLAGMKGFISWDGTDLGGRRARTGIYLILVQVFDLQGSISQYKETCVLSPGR